MMDAVLLANRIHKVTGVGVMPYEIGSIPDEWIEYIDAVAGLLNG